MKLPAIAVAALVALPLFAATEPAGAATRPTKLGQCVSTIIKAKGPRVTGMSQSGDVVIYANGIAGVSYDTVPALHNTRLGDAVNLCLTSIPSGCPAGDDRGRTYTATDIVSGATWELPDAEHKCGGA